MPDAHDDHSPLPRRRRLPAGRRSATTPASRPRRGCRPACGRAPTRRPATRGRWATSAGARTRPPTATASAAATATAIVVRSSTAAGGRSRIDSSRPAPGGAVQVRPARPRPAVWWSATSTIPSGSPWRASSIASAFVDPVSATHRTSAKRGRDRSASADLARPPGTQVTIWRAHQGPHRQPGRDRCPSHPRLQGDGHRHGGGVLRARPGGAARPPGRRGLRARAARPPPRAT